MYQTLQTLHASLKIKNTEEVPFGETESGPKLTKNSSVWIYEGDLEGQGVLEELKVHFNSSNAVMQGLQRFTGRLLDRTGSFILKYDGRVAKGEVSSKLSVVPTSASSELKGLRGEMILKNTAPQEFSVTFNYHFF